MALTNFRASDFGGKGKQPADRKAKAAPEKTAAVSNEVPSGTTEEILAWVGDDLDRAGKAREAELLADKPRASVLDALPGSETETETGAPDVSADEAAGYPEGAGVEAIKAWVGDDTARAGFALTRENERDKPRKGVLDYIDGLGEKA